MTTETFIGVYAVHESGSIGSNLEAIVRLRRSALDTERSRQSLRRASPFGQKGGGPLLPDSLGQFRRTAVEIDRLACIDDHIRQLACKGIFPHEIPLFKAGKPKG